VKQILDSNQIRDGVGQLAEQVKAIYEGRPLTIVAILTGSLVLLADLIRQLEMPLRVALVQANRLRTPDDPQHQTTISEALLPNLKDRDVLVIDDIFDTGHTLVEVLAQLLQHEPASLRSAVLMRKISRWLRIRLRGPFS
jgi:hypoxanthine phosphoribosyltransferase